VSYRAFLETPRIHAGEERKLPAGEENIATEVVRAFCNLLLKCITNIYPPERWRQRSKTTVRQNLTLRFAKICGAPKLAKLAKLAKLTVLTPKH
jgi:hypothetical protein